MLRLYNGIVNQLFLGIFGRRSEMPVMPIGERSCTLLKGALPQLTRRSCRKIRTVLDACTEPFAYPSVALALIQILRLSPFLFFFFLLFFGWMWWRDAWSLCKCLACQYARKATDTNSNRFKPCAGAGVCIYPPDQNLVLPIRKLNFVSTVKILEPRNASQFWRIASANWINGELMTNESANLVRDKNPFHGRCNGKCRYRIAFKRLTGLFQTLARQKLLRVFWRRMAAKFRLHWRTPLFLSLGMASD